MINIQLLNSGTRHSSKNIFGSFNKQLHGYKSLGLGFVMCKDHNLFVISVVQVEVVMLLIESHRRQQSVNDLLFRWSVGCWVLEFCLERVSPLDLIVVDLVMDIVAIAIGKADVFFSECELVWLLEFFAIDLQKIPGAFFMELAVCHFQECNYRLKWILPFKVDGTL